jgi:hypothetical protein
MYAFILPFIFILFSCAPENSKSELSGESETKFDHWDPRTIEYKTIEDRYTENYYYMSDKCKNVYTDPDELRRLAVVTGAPKNNGITHKCGPKLTELTINCGKIATTCVGTSGTKFRVKAGTTCELAVAQGVRAATEFYQECVMGGKPYFPKSSGSNYPRRTSSDEEDSINRDPTGPKPSLGDRSGS